MSRNICITAVEGHTGHLIAELLLTDENFRKQFDSLAGLSLHPSTSSCKELEKLGAKIIPHKPGRVREMVKTLQRTGADTMCLIPPAHVEKFDITAELIEAAKKANIPNVCFISSAGADLAERDKQPRLREFIDLECLFMSSKGDLSTATGHSPVIIRLGFRFSPGTDSWINIQSKCGILRREPLTLFPSGQRRGYAAVAHRKVP